MREFESPSERWDLVRVEDTVDSVRALELARAAEDPSIQWARDADEPDRFGDTVSEPGLLRVSMPHEGVTVRLREPRVLEVVARPYRTDDPGRVVFGRLNSVYSQLVCEPYEGVPFTVLEPKRVMETYDAAAQLVTTYSQRQASARVTTAADRLTTDLSVLRSSYGTVKNVDELLEQAALLRDRIENSRDFLAQRTHELVVRLGALSVAYIEDRTSRASIPIARMVVESLTAIGR